MFPPTYFPPSYFGPGYFPGASGPTVSVQPTLFYVSVEPIDASEYVVTLKPL